MSRFFLSVDVAEGTQSNETYIRMASLDSFNGLFHRSSIKETEPLKTTFWGGVVEHASCNVVWPWVDILT